MMEEFQAVGRFEEDLGVQPVVDHIWPFEDGYIQKINRSLVDLMGEFYIRVLGIEDVHKLLYPAPWVGPDHEDIVEVSEIHLGFEVRGKGFEEGGFKPIEEEIGHSWGKAPAHRESRFLEIAMAIEREIIEFSADIQELQRGVKNRHLQVWGVGT